MSIQVFMSPTLTGKRFDDHSIPFEILAEFVALEEMIKEVAKWRFLQDNPKRKRTRRGFMDGVSLQLNAVAEGSAIAKICLALLSIPGLLPPENQSYFEDARDSIVHAIGAAQRGEAISQFLPDKFLSYFDRFGRSLREDEAIEFQELGQSSPARLTQAVRQKLVLAPTQVEVFTQEVSIQGAVSEADHKNQTFKLELDDTTQVPAHFELAHYDKIIAAFVGYDRGLRVQIDGIAKLNRKLKLQEFESIEQVSILDPLDVRIRLAELRNMEDGWLEGDGKAPSHAGLDWLIDVFDEYFPPGGVAMPYIYPTPDGNIRAEWSVYSHEISLDIDLGLHSAEFHDLNLDDDSENEIVMNLNEELDWQRLSGHIATCARRSYE